MSKNFQKCRLELIKNLVESGISEETIGAFKRVQREHFVREEYKDSAYDDMPLPLFENSTISQPSTVAAMTEALDVKEGMKILEVGTGSGYQAALLSVQAGEKGKIITLEANKEVFEFGKENLKNYRNVEAILSDGSAGYEKQAPYDRIIVTASASILHDEFVKQLKINGIMVIPVGKEMFRIIKVSETEIKKEFMGYYAFVPLKEE